MTPISDLQRIMAPLWPLGPVERFSKNSVLKSLSSETRIGSWAAWGRAPRVVGRLESRLEGRFEGRFEGCRFVGCWFVAGRLEGRLGRLAAF